MEWTILFFAGFFLAGKHRPSVLTDFNLRIYFSSQIYVPKASALLITVYNAYIESTAAKIQSSLKKDKTTVVLGKFTDKVRRSVSYKNPKTGWVIDKDTAGHGGRA
ncbi:hypothetical protein [Aneurinibacillus terranovensis]|uniref:hypothetical protein n=1 Tax=Aneurinibacillus terranovensis TaxID=278991 RepID=UPI0004894997|nr:hypothetical protein [Aneurinibacillus terranovensis]